MKNQFQSVFVLIFCHLALKNKSEQHQVTMSTESQQASVGFLNMCQTEQMWKTHQKEQGSRLDWDQDRRYWVQGAGLGTVEAPHMEVHCDGTGKPKQQITHDSALQSLCTT